MRREPRAFLLDVIEACDGIATAIDGLELDAYAGNRLVRSAVERELITIGEAVGALRQAAPDLFSRISQAQKIIDFRNQLTHGYMTVNDALVWAVAVRDAPPLRRECADLLQELEGTGAD